MRAFLLAAILASLCGTGAMAEMTPQVVDTLFETDDVVIASLVVDAPRDGSADVTAALQAAIDEAAAAGGGVVFLPAGRYLMAGRLTMKEGVTLRGDWTPPTAEDAYAGTLLMLTGGCGEADADETITLERGSGVRDVAIWYPEQDPSNVVPYPWTFRTSRAKTGDNYTIHNVTLVNPYQAIRIGPEWNELHTIRNVYGTPLKTGIWVDTTTDIGRLIEVDFSPRWWEQSGLANAPVSDAAQDAFRSFMTQEGVGVDMGRSDWEYIYGVRLDGFGVGFKFRRGERGTTNAVMFGCDAISTGTALLVERLNGVGLSATGCRFLGRKEAAHGPPSFTTVVQFNTCRFASHEGPCALLEGRGWFTFQNCTFDLWNTVAIDAPAGNVTALGCEFAQPGPHVALGKDVVHARILGNRFEEEPAIVDGTENADVQIAHTGLEFAQPDVSPHPAPPDPCPAGRSLFVVTDFGASPDAEDNTQAFTQALTEAGNAGGGTVYVPAGNYRFAGNLKVPTGVELRGIFDVPHHTVSAGSVLMPTAEKGEEDGVPFIRLETTSGLRGLTFWYPEQDITNMVAYPWAIQGLGPGCWLLDVTLGNAYQGVDFWTNPSDGHLVRYLAGSFFKRGLFVSKCNGDGWVEDTQFNPHYTARAPGHLPRPYKGQPWDTMIQYVFRNLDGIVFGRCENEHVKGTFLYAAYDGLAFRDDGGGTNARVIQHGTDAGSRGVVLEATGERGVDFINGQIVHFGPAEKAALVTTEAFAGKARLFNTQMWAGPKSGVLAGTGDLLIQQLNTTTGPFEISGGACTIENVRFARALRPHIRVDEGCTRVQLNSNMTDASLQVDNAAGDRCRGIANSIGVPPSPGASQFSSGFEEGDPAPTESTVATSGGIRTVSGHECTVTDADAHTGERSLRLKGNADDPSYSFVYFRIFDQPVVLWADSVLSYWVKPLNERALSTTVDLTFDKGPPMRDTGARTVDGKAARTGAGLGKVGEWVNVRVPLGGKTVTGIMVAYDSRSGGGPFEALFDDISITSELGRSPAKPAATPAGGRVEVGTKVALESENRLRIRYTLDGMLPDASSPVYEGPIVLDKPGLWDVRFVAETADGLIGGLVGGELYEVVPK